MDEAAIQKCMQGMMLFMYADYLLLFGLDSTNVWVDRYIPLSGICELKHKEECFNLYDHMYKW